MAKKKKKDTSTGKAPEDSLWEVKESPGKGRGIFATQDLPRGTLIMLEEPAMRVRHAPNQPCSQEAVQAAFNAMTVEQEERFMRLSAEGRKDKTTKLLRIFDTNFFTGNVLDVSCICLNLSLLNHSCVENASWHIRLQADNFLVTATSFIPKGDEITINYAPSGSFYTAAQRAALFATFGNFKCDCKACKINTDFRKASDMRRVLLVALNMILQRAHGRSPVELPPNHDIALRTTNGSFLFQLNFQYIDQFVEADYTFVWWLSAKLYEAEGLFNDRLREAYQGAVYSLEKRLDEIGKSGKPVQYLAVYLDHLNTWTKIAVDVERIIERPYNMPAYTPPGQASWRRIKVSQIPQFIHGLPSSFVSIRTQADHTLENARGGCQNHSFTRGDGRLGSYS